MPNPSILQDFERRLEGAVEGFFARAFRSGLQPIELAKGIKRYAEQQRQVASDGVVIPNTYRFRVHPRDHERLAGYGPRLATELAAVVEQTASDEGWSLAGPVGVDVVADDTVAYGIFRLAGRIDAEADGTPAAAPAAPAAPPRDESHDDQHTAVDMTGAFARTRTNTALVLPDGSEVVLVGARMVAGRVGDADVTVDHSTVSRSHAAFVRRGDDWWVLDLGSTNGTRVNGRTAAEQPVRPGDRLELGEAIVEVVER